MALAHVANRGALSAKAAGASLDLVLAAGQGIGLDRLVLVWAAWDNSDNVNDATTRLSASDEVANTYTPVVEFTQGGGAAAAGVTAFLAAAVTSTAPAEGDFIRVTSNDATRVAKVVSVAEFSKAAGSTIVVAAVDADGGTGGGAFAPTLVDLPERPYLLAGGFVYERGDHATLSFDQDDDYTDIGFASTLGGGANSNLSLFGGFRIATVTGDTWGVSVGAAAGECAHFLVAFYEVDDGGIVEAITAAVETALAATLGRLKRLILPVAAEADTAAELGKAKRVVIAPATTVATVATLAARKTLALPAAAEADTAGTLAVVQEGEQVVAIDAAVETAEVAALGTAKRLGLVAAPETDAAAALAIAKRVAIAAAAETALAQALARRKTIALAPALEADAAQTLGAPKMLTITPAVETDVALVLALAGEVVPLELLRAYVTLIRAAARARVVRASAPVAIIPTRGDVRVHA